jgi:hypothetical protein
MHGLTLLGQKALDFHKLLTTEITFFDHAESADEFSRGDLIWIREPWRTFSSLDGTEDDQIWHPGARRGAWITFDAGGPSLSIAKRVGERRGPPQYHYGGQDLRCPGRLRPAATMPRWASRSCAIITDMLVAADGMTSCTMLMVRPFAENIDDLISSGGEEQ